MEHQVATELDQYDGRIAAIGRPPDGRGWIVIHVGRLKFSSEPAERQYLQIEVVLKDEAAPNGLTGFDSHDTELLEEDLSDFQNDIVRVADQEFPVTWLEPAEADRVRSMLKSRTATRKHGRRWLGRGKGEG